ncbi:insulinase family protein [Dehalobacter sp. DCM]|uniref:M16 family metallopeptidase n=1 Tax=Dehalobacter sp. DCM TaxID=2907827 RepID=UPI003081B8F6|nr:insulinase family protein [Dehalobacter sp. DCM]
MYRKHVLPNGVRIITEEIDFVRSAAIGIWVGTGSRKETEGYEGISHFIEHMFFKGTQKRTARQLAESLEIVGGQINAFTTKEMTCFYAKVLDEDLPLAIDVLSDMFFNSLFDTQEIEKEKNVVIEEIKMYQDTPDELIHDLFSQYAWNNDPLGKPILGIEETIRGLTREKILHYIETQYTPDQIVIAVAGKINHDDIVRQLSMFGDFNRKKTDGMAENPQGSTFRKTVGKDTEQMHLIIGVPGLGQDDEDMYPLHIINNILGGGLSSRLFQEIREQRGLAYSVYSYHSTYVDTGLFAVYAGTSPENTDQVIKCVLDELNTLKNDGLTEEELKNAKAQIKGNLYLGLESVSSRMSRLGKTELCFGEYKTPEEAVEKLEKVTVADVKRVMERLWQKEKVSILTLGQKDYHSDFEQIMKEAF